MNSTTIANLLKVTKNNYETLFVIDRIHSYIMSLDAEENCIMNKKLKRKYNLLRNELSLIHLNALEVSLNNTSIYVNISILCRLGRMQEAKKLYKTIKYNSDKTIIDFWKMKSDYYYFKWYHYKNEIDFDKAFISIKIAEAKGNPYLIIHYDMIKFFLLLQDWNGCMNKCTDIFILLSKSEPNILHTQIYEAAIEIFLFCQALVNQKDHNLLTYSNLIFNRTSDNVKFNFLTRFFARGDGVCCEYHKKNNN